MPRSRLTIFSAVLVIVASGLIGYRLVRPAAAAQGVICELYDNYCLNATSLDWGTPIKERYGAGRDLLEVESHTYYVRLEFVADQSKCIGLDLNNHTGIIVKYCRDDGTDWFPTAHNGGGVYFNNRWAADHGYDKFLSGANNGSQYVLRSYQASGWYQVYNNI